MKNEMSEVGRLRTFFFSVCREHGIDEETAKNLNLALEEWVANVINYAYPKGMRGHVEVTADVSDHKLLTLVIKDHGVAFDPTQYSEADVDAELDDRQIGDMNIEIKEQNGTYVGILSGWLDTNESSQFIEDLKVLEENIDKPIVLDCKNLEYICSLALRGLLKLKKESAAKGGRLVLRNVEGEVRNILTLTGFIKLFDFE